MDRIERYLDARRGMGGLDPDSIHEVGTHEGIRALLISDLDTVLDALIEEPED
jgi:hypothetical protein